MRDWTNEITGYVVIVLLFQLLCVSPAPNVLSLVYRDQDSLRFNKYLNHRATDSSESSFFAIAMVYKESNVGTNLEPQWMLPLIVHLVVNSPFALFTFMTVILVNCFHLLGAQ